MTQATDVAALRIALEALRDRTWFIIGVNDPAIIAADAALGISQTPTLPARLTEGEVA